jgi:hypothetical protein
MLGADVRVMAGVVVVVGVQSLLWTCPPPRLYDDLDDFLEQV